MQTTISKRYRFEAAHKLPNHDGKCRNLHGHSYEVEVGVTGPIRETEGASDQGMVVDFGVLSAAFKARVHDRLDHRYLNDELGFLTTAENIAAWVFEEIGAELVLLGYSEVAVAFVRVHETATSCAEVRA